MNKSIMAQLPNDIIMDIIKIATREGNIDYWTSLCKPRINRMGSGVVLDGLAVIIQLEELAEECGYMPTNEIEGNVINIGEYCDCGLLEGLGLAYHRRGLPGWFLLN
jgi:hypothetical protein